MQEAFFLSSHDYVSTPEPRECRIIGEAVRCDNKKVILRVEITPPLHGLLPGSADLTTLLLVPGHRSYQLSEIGKSPYIVDICALQNDVVRDEYDPRELVRLVTGQLHSTLKEAIRASPKGGLYGPF